MGWQAKEQDGVGNWLQLIWPEEVEIGRVVIYTRSVADCEVQVPGEKEGEWATVGKVTPGAQPLEATFKPVKTKSLRILVTKLREGQHYSDTQEVEAYAK